MSAVLSHQSAAQKHGWELKNQPERPVVTVPRNRKITADRREGVELRWGRLAPGEVTSDGVTVAGRTIIDCAKSLPFDEALTIADSALRHRNITKGHLLKLATAVQGPGRQTCIKVAEHADGLAANPFESVLRAIALEVPGLAVKPQVVITDLGLNIRPDLVDRNRRLVLEADSFEFHGQRRQLKRDCERYDLLVVAGWTVLRFAWEHVMFQPGFVHACLVAVCGGGDATEVQHALRRTA
jgi:very-short-patch-repair endonuclease